MSSSAKFTDRVNDFVCKTCGENHNDMENAGRRIGDPVGSGTTLATNIFSFYWNDRRRTASMHHPFSVSPYRTPFDINQAFNVLAAFNDDSWGEEVDTGYKRNLNTTVRRISQSRRNKMSLARSHFHGTFPLFDITRFTEAEVNDLIRAFRAGENIDPNGDGTIPYQETNNSTPTAQKFSEWEAEAHHLINSEAITVGEGGATIEGININTSNNSQSAPGIQMQGLPLLTFDSEEFNDLFQINGDNVFPSDSIHPEWYLVCYTHGYDINRAQNGVFLPRYPPLACKLGVPLHAGNHSRGMHRYASQDGTARNYIRIVRDLITPIKDNALEGMYCDPNLDFVKDMDRTSAEIWDMVSKFILLLTWDGAHYEKTGGEGAEPIPEFLCLDIGMIVTFVPEDADKPRNRRTGQLYQYIPNPMRVANNNMNIGCFRHTLIGQKETNLEANPDEARFQCQRVHNEIYGRYFDNWETNQNIWWPSKNKNTSGDWGSFEEQTVGYQVPAPNANEN